MNIGVPEPQLPNSLPRKPFGSIGVARASSILGMSATVQLDGDSSLQTEEIEDECSDRMLSSKFEARELPGTESLPKNALWRSQFTPQAAGVLAIGRR